MKTKVHLLWAGRHFVQALVLSQDHLSAIWRLPEFDRLPSQPHHLFPQVHNPTGTKDAINEIFMEAWVKHVNVDILGTTIQEENKQEIESLSWKTIDVLQPDYEPENVTAMIMQRTNVAFLPDISSFCNTRVSLNVLRKWDLRADHDS